jgi:hypothetical protein
MELHSKNIYKTASGRNFLFKSRLTTVDKMMHEREIGSIEFSSDEGGEMIINEHMYVIHRDLKVAHANNPDHLLAWVEGPPLKAVPWFSKWTIKTKSSSLRVKCGIFGIGDIHFSDNQLEFYFKHQLKIATIDDINDSATCAVLAILIVFRGALCAWD